MFSFTGIKYVEVVIPLCHLIGKNELIYKQFVYIAQEIQVGVVFLLAALNWVRGLFLLIKALLLSIFNQIGAECQKLIFLSPFLLAN